MKKQDNTKARKVGFEGGWKGSNDPATNNEPLPQVELKDVLMAPGWGWTNTDLDPEVIKYLTERRQENILKGNCPGHESHDFELTDGKMICHRCGAMLCKECKGSGEALSVPTPPYIEYELCNSCQGKGFI